MKGKDVNPSTILYNVHTHSKIAFNMDCGVTVPIPNKQQHPDYAKSLPTTLTSYPCNEKSRSYEYDQSRLKNYNC